MPSHTQDDVEAIARRRLISRFEAALLATKRIENYHERAMAMLEQLAEVDPLEIIQVWRFKSKSPALPPVASQAGDRSVGHRGL